MSPVSFHPAEKLYTLPGDDSVLPLPVLKVTFNDGVTGLISCWKPSWKDRLRLILGKPIYLALYSSVQPPVSVFTEDLELKEW